MSASSPSNDPILNYLSEDCYKCQVNDIQRQRRLKKKLKKNKKQEKIIHREQQIFSSENMAERHE